MKFKMKLSGMIGCLAIVVSSGAFAWDHNVWGSKEMNFDNTDYSNIIQKVDKPTTYLIGKNKVEFVEDYKITKRGSLFRSHYLFFQEHHPSSYDKDTQLKSAQFKNKIAGSGYWVNKSGEYYIITESNYDKVGGREVTPDYNPSEEYKAAMMSQRFKIEQYTSAGSLHKTGYYYVRPSVAFEDSSWIHLRGYDSEYSPQFYGAFAKILDDKTIVLEMNEKNTGYTAQILKKSNIKPIPAYEHLIIPYMKKHNVDEDYARMHYSTREFGRRTNDTEEVPPNVVIKK